MSGIKMDEIKIHDLHFHKFIGKEVIEQRVQEMGAQLYEEYKDRSPVFLGMLNGAFVFMADLIRAFPAPAEVSFIRYSSYDGTESTRELKADLRVDQKLAGKDIILVEDIIDSGFSMHEFLPILHSINPGSIKIVSLLYKEKALKFPVKPDLFGFDIPTKFVVGYGLDYHELGRNLSDIYVLSS
jgi:hypoxanthine phosphoribosyltransferase